MIDLHLHTTASDGRATPEELVQRAWSLGIRTMSVTDHDTRSGEVRARSAANALGMELISGIEITSVHAGKDVHVLAYGLPPEAPEIDAILRTQRGNRINRAKEIANRLARLGAPIDIEALIAAASQASGKAVARPQIAQWLIASGHVATVSEAFDRYLGEHAGAYVPHQGASPAAIVALVRNNGGVASLAHPGQLKRDELVAELVEAGLPCIEAYHSSHDEAAQTHYLEMAKRYGLLVTGGSDYHGEGTRRAEFLGVIGLPREHYDRLAALMEEARLETSRT